MFDKIQQGTLLWFLVCVITVLLIVVGYFLKRRDKGLDIAVKMLGEALCDKRETTGCDLIVKNFDINAKTLKESIDILSSKIDSLNNQLCILYSRISKVEGEFSMFDKDIKFNRRKDD